MNGVEQGDGKGGEGENDRRGELVSPVFYTKVMPLWAGSRQ